MRFLIFVCGEGLGHTGRCISLANELLVAGHSVHIGAYGYSKELIERSGHRATEIPQELQLTGKDGSLDLKNSIMSTVKGISPGKIRMVRNLLKKTNPDFVISDGYYLGIIAAKFKGIRRCMIVNQSSMQEFFKGKGLVIGLAGSAVRAFYTWIYNHIDIIFVPDFSPPFTICGSNLAFPLGVEKKVEFSGPVLRKRFDEVVPKDNVKRPHVLCSIGGFGYRLQIFKTIVKAAAMDLNINYTLIGGPDLDYDVLDNVPGNVDICRFVADPFPYYRSSDLIICTGGHGTLTESLSFGLPVISFPDQSHNEQENNARLLEKNGYGLSFSYSVSPEELMGAIHSLINDEKFRSNTSELKKQAQLMDGPAYIRKRLEKYESSHSH
ncbi:glycosyltransferase [Methanolobus sp. ZRKC5]|uniref:UDP-N-acetylglucosamine--N-acetylmuramyl- (pentapeptide) pyrophosphoryl-undecaprenol N-acetylglucosamine transferase n=1 Tax=unclassified Methanolobus TaxID=2629569 RepID=UPI00313EA2C6